MALQTHVDPPYYDWSEIQVAVKARTNRDVRNWKNKQFVKGKKDAPYCDFWHMLIDYFEGEIHNGAILEIDFEEMADFFDTKATQQESPKDFKWVREVCEEIIALLGPGEHRVKTEW